MKTIDQWLLAYSDSHQNKFNVYIHKLAVPAIVVSLFGILWCIPFPKIANLYFLNWSIIASIPIIIFYFKLSTSLALGMSILMGIQFVLFNLVESIIDIALWEPMVIIFIIAWFLQFIGHYIEGKRPSFFEDLTFLFIGPLWVLAAFYKKLGIRLRLSL